MSDISEDDQPTPTQDENDSEEHMSVAEDGSAPSERVEEDPHDILDIKPPQASNKKEKRKHKHKSDRKRQRSKSERDKHRHASRDRSRGRRKESSREHRRDKHSESSRGRDKNTETRVQRDFTAAADDDARRREKSSNKERDRLERLERERRRIEREGVRRERAHKEMLKRTEGGSRERHEPRERDRRPRDDGKTSAPAQTWRAALQKANRSDSSAGRDDSRSRREDRRDGRSRDQERPRSRSPLHRGDVDERVTEPATDRDERVRRPETRRHVEEVARVATLGEPEEGEEDDSSDSDSESDDDSEASESEDDDAKSADDDQEDGEIQEEPGNVRSKFETPEREESDDEEESGSDEGDDEDQGEDGVDASPEEVKPDLPIYYPALQGCRSVDEFECLNRIEEGTYGVVFRARDKKLDEIVALKRLKMEKEKEGFPITSLREINTLLKAQHQNIVTVREIVVGSNIDRIYIVMDFVEHDMKSLMETMKEPFLAGEVKTLLIQLLRGVQHMHDNWILHRDLKTSNLLLSHKGILKIGDFGLAREYGSPLKPYTSVVVTLWYRAPELLLGVKEYSCPIDLWSVGCIFAEFLNRKPLFPGKSEVEQLNHIFKALGSPTEAIWPGVGELPVMKKVTFAKHPYNILRKRFNMKLTDRGFALLNRFLTYNPAKRITPEEALRHDYFVESPVPIDPSMFPTWPARSEMSHKKSAHGNSPKPPSGGKAYAKLLGGDDDETIAAKQDGGFHMGMFAASSGGFSLKF